MKWEKVRLGDVTDSCLGKMLDKEKNRGEYQLYLSNKDVRWGSFDLEHLDLMKFEEHEEERYGVRYGDLIVCEGGEPGRCAIWKDQIPNMKIQKALHRVRVHEDLDYRYLYYWFLWAGKRGELQQYFTGATIKHMPGDKLKSVIITKPDIKTQRQIADVLSAYDELIENNQKQIRLLEEAAQRLYKEWFVDLHFPGYENTHIVDGLPEGWCVKSILDNDIFVFAKSMISPFDGEKRYFATADVTGTVITSDGETITFANRPSRAAIQPLVNSVWFARMSNSYKIINCFGESAYLADDSIISTGFAGFTAAEGCYGFVYETIASNIFNEEKNRYATGATQVSLTNEGLKKIKVLIPTEELVIQYSNLIEPFMQKAEALKKNSSFLRQARDRLLPKLMSGEIEV